MTEARRLLDAYLEAASARGGKKWAAVPRVEDLAGGNAILSASADIQAEVLHAGWLACPRLASSSGLLDGRLAYLTVLLSRLMQQAPPLTAAQLADAVGAVTATPYPLNLPVDQLLTLTQRHIRARGLDPALRGAIAALHHKATSPAFRPFALPEAHAESILVAAQGTGAVGSDPVGPWTATVFTELARGPAPAAACWADLLQHAATASASVPSAKWLSKAALYVEKIGREEFRHDADRWLRLGPAPGAPREHPTPELDADVLKGFVWCVAARGESDLAVAVAELCEQAFRKISGLGPVCARVGNACVNVLARLPGGEPVAQLGRLRLKVKYQVALRLIEKAFNEVSRREGVSREDLEEMAVPTYGLSGDGWLRREVGACTVELRVRGHYSELAYLGPDGRRLRAAPSQVKREHATELRGLQKLGKQVDAMLIGQRDRLERLLGAERSLDYRAWRERYVDQPLLAQMARTLIWRFERGNQSALGVPLRGEPVGLDGQAIPWSPEARVRLWHPLGCPNADVQAWRQWLSVHGVTQPFKQAHRELYLLTDAELATETYSNRFAAHVIKQHQFAALCRERGWRYGLQGTMFDGANVPTLELPAVGLAAEFWVECPDAGVESSTAGIALYVTTDQVRFVGRDGNAVRLDSVPALVFSEVMRDIDLFVSVCSIGNDPEWQDSGVPTPDGYWHTFAFGELSEVARTRRAVLETILPALTIAERCAFDERHLVVRGDLASYRIHLGSGSVLIEPGSRYLCIVPVVGRGPADNVQLPFEGDRMLSVILSKAFLLAEDASIDDPAIRQQIETAPRAPLTN